MKWCKWCKNNRGIVLAVVLAILVGLAYIPLLDNGFLCWGEGWIVQKCKEDTNPITTALALAGAVLIIANMCFVVIRIDKTNTQIEEATNSNFLNALNNGVNMLHSGDYSKKRPEFTISIGLQRQR